MLQGDLIIFPYFGSYIFMRVTKLFILIALGLISCSKSDLPSGSDLSKFDSIVWQSEASIASDKNMISEREKMLKDLVEHILPGKSKSEIEQLLGNSLDTPYFKSIDKDLIYYMGPERDSMFTIDSEWLLIWLDDSGKFNKYKIMKD